LLAAQLALYGRADYRKCDFHRTDVNENRELIATPCFLCALFLIDMFLIYHISPISTHPITKFSKIFLKRQGVRRSTSQHALERAPESDHSANAASEVHSARTGDAGQFN